MKFINLIFIIYFILSCSSKKDITEFENILGKENSKTLTYLVNDFESDYLSRQYPNLNTQKAYRKFLTDVLKGKNEYWKQISKSSKKHFEKSNLRLEIYSIPDSIWIEPNPQELNSNYENIPMLKIKRKFLKPDGTFDYNISESFFRYKKSMNVDSIIESRKNWVHINYAGSYIKALNSISNKSQFLTEYLDMRDKAGRIDQRQIADKMLKNKVDLSDYFIKRLIITEIIY